MNDSFRICITLDTDSRYTEIPTDWKSYFRPIAFVEPNMETISTVLLFANGFLQAYVSKLYYYYECKKSNNLVNLMQVLAKKLVTFYQMAKELVSEQYHYDWGLRSLKAVIEFATKELQNQPDCREMIILIQSLQRIHFSKLIGEDIPPFLNLFKV